jgi:tryptophan-rich sensory protein
LDGALRSDGVCVVAYFTSTEAVRHATALRGWSVFIVARPQCRVVVDVFLAHSPLLGLINIVPQFVVILATVVRFARLDSLAAICLLPLVGWVAFAGILLAIKQLTDLTIRSPSRHWPKADRHII